MSKVSNDSSDVPSKMDWVSIINESVHTSDDMDIGDIQAVNSSFIVVKRGFVNIHYYYVPLNKVEGWDGYVLWLRISEQEVEKNFERNVPPDPLRYYLKDYPYYTTRYYPELRMIPSRYVVPTFDLKTKSDKTSQAETQTQVYQCDLCNTKFGTENELGDHVNQSH
ncbi:MAG: hypothetical protein WA941_03340 [Nitrososphaeraceae archaeon]